MTEQRGEQFTYEAWCQRCERTTEHVFGACQACTVCVPHARPEARTPYTGPEAAS